MYYTRQHTGKQGEEIAVNLLEKKGWQIIGRNMHTRLGEIDILAESQGVLHVVEVKTRRSQEFGGPVYALTPKKFFRIKKAAAEIRKSLSLQHQFLPVQYDFVAIQIFTDDKYEIDCFWNIGDDDLM